MDKKLAKKIAEKIEENIETITSKPESVEYIKGTTPSEDGDRDKFLSGRSRLLALLIDHPYFQENVKKIREKYKLPEQGFSDRSEAHMWEHENTDTYHARVLDVESLIGGFEIPKIFRSSTWGFISDYIIAPVRSEHSSTRYYPVFRLVRTDEDRKVNQFLVNPNSLYVEIFDWTTKRDMDAAWSKITKSKKTKLPFGVSRVDALARDVWLLSQGDLSDKEISSKIQEELRGSNDERIFGYDDVPIYRKRYKEALNSLRKLDK